MNEYFTINRKRELIEELYALLQSTSRIESYKHLVNITGLIDLTLPCDGKHTCTFCSRITGRTNL
jgi:hypothetical protein